MNSTQEVFLLTRDWHDTPHGLELVLWAIGEEGPVRAVLCGQERNSLVVWLARSARSLARA